MPQLSRYSDEHVEQLLSELSNVLETHKAPADLSPMVRSNMVTNLINSMSRRRSVRRFVFAVLCSLQSTTTRRTKDNQQLYMVTLRQPLPRKKSPQMVSWGHWFALFNMLLPWCSATLSFVADWPTTLGGRIFVASASWVTSVFWYLPAMS